MNSPARAARARPGPLRSPAPTPVASQPGPAPPSRESARLVGEAVGVVGARAHAHRRGGALELLVEATLRAVAGTDEAVAGAAALGLGLTLGNNPGVETFIVSSSANIANQAAALAHYAHHTF